MGVGRFNLHKNKAFSTQFYVDQQSTKIQNQIFDLQKTTLKSSKTDPKGFPIQDICSPEKSFLGKKLPRQFPKILDWC